MVGHVQGSPGSIGVFSHDTRIIPVPSTFRKKIKKPGKHQGSLKTSKPSLCYQKSLFKPNFGPIPSILFLIFSHVSWSDRTSIAFKFPVLNSVGLCGGFTKSFLFICFVLRFLLDNLIYIAGCPTFNIKRKLLDHVDKRRYQEIVVMYQTLNCLLESTTLKSPGQISFSTSLRQHQV
jgi:hypothetical protein